MALIEITSLLLALAAVAAFSWMVVFLHDGAFLSGLLVSGVGLLLLRASTATARVAGYAMRSER
ncbi:MAG: hypothetical protein EA398_07890 [Deltaproteobacteria bacterium]|nr:MAG: hypothetical protein EA398_07890 [Deltaproteobacteria bacterium]